MYAVYSFVESIDFNQIKLTKQLNEIYSQQKPLKSPSQKNKVRLAKMPLFLAKWVPAM